MKRMLAITLLVITCICAAHAHVRNDAENDSVAIYSTQNYKLYGDNFSSFLLDTRTGQIWKVTARDKASGKEGTKVCTQKDDLSQGNAFPGRFSFGSIGNLDSFIMVDEHTGRCWFVIGGKIKWELKEEQ